MGTLITIISSILIIGLLFYMIIRWLDGQREFDRRILRETRGACLRLVNWYRAEYQKNADRAYLTSAGVTTTADALDKGCIGFFHAARVVQTYAFGHLLNYFDPTGVIVPGAKLADYCIMITVQGDLPDDIYTNREKYPFEFEGCPVYYGVRNMLWRDDCLFVI